MSLIPLKQINDVRDGTHDTPTKLKEGIKLITSRHIKNNSIIETDYFITKDDALQVEKRSKVDKWDILVTMIGTVGDLYLVDEEPDFVIKNIGLIKTNGDEGLARYLYYYLKSKKGQAEIKSRLSGTSQQFISLGNLRSLQVNIPDRDLLAEISESLRLYDELIRTNLTRISILQQMADMRFDNFEHATENK